LVWVVSAARLMAREAGQLAGSVSEVDDPDDGKGHTERHKYDRRPHRRDPAELSSPSVSYRQLDDGKTLDDDGPLSAATHQNLVKAAGRALACTRSTLPG